MKKFLCLIILLPYFSFAQIPAGYYDGTAGLSSFHLKSKLKEIISKKNINWNYGDLPEWYKITDRDLWYENDSTILDIYAENPTGIDPYNYTYEVPSLISGAGEEGLGWNREHIFSQSFFYSNYPMYADLHFIVPTDARVNQRRSNLPFAEVGSSTTFTSLNGSLVGLSVTPGYTLTVFEPIDEFKGDIARMLLYVAVRYENFMPYFQFDNNRSPFQYNYEKAIKDWMLPLLMTWHNDDPVSPRELYRNNKIYELQGNRNPFIDHPEWVSNIWTTSTDAIAPLAPIYLSNLNKGDNFITLSWEIEPDVSIVGYKVYINDSFVANTQKREFVFTALSPATSYSFKVKAYDVAYNESPFSIPINIATLSADTFGSDLYISKYIYGSDNNRVLEVTNKTGHTVDLRNYTIGMRQINGTTGGLYWSDNEYQMEGYLPHNQSVILSNPFYSLTCLPKDSIDFITNGTPLTFDGRLALSLRNGSTTIDMIGNADNDDVYFAVDKSLYRNDTIKDGNSTWDLSEWTEHPLDFCEGLGNAFPTSIPDIASQNNFHIYPNPNVDGILYFDGVDLHKIQTIKITDVLGKVLKIYHQPFLQNNYIKLPELASGIYFVDIDGMVMKLKI